MSVENLNEFVNVGSGLIVAQPTHTEEPLQHNKSMRVLFGSDWQHIAQDIPLISLHLYKYESGDFALAKSPLSPNPMLKEGLAHHKE